MKKFVILTILFCLPEIAAIAADQNNPQNPQLQQLLQAANPTPAATTTTTTTTNPPTVSNNAATQTTETTVTANPTPAPVASANVPAVDTGGDLREEAFAGVANSTLPLTPAQIRTLHLLFDQTQRAVAEYPGVPPIPTSTSLQVSLAPGATPPVIRLSSGFVTSLVFLDRSGQPWPIRAIDNGDSSAFNIQPTSFDQSTNTLLVQAITQYKTANLAVQLKGLNTPIMLTLLAGQRAVDYRVDLHIPGLGPNGIASISGLPAPASPLLLNILSGIPPEGSKQLQVDPIGYADVWLWQSNLYIRTRATILSPAWLTVMSSSDGTNAYKMTITPLLIVSLSGKTVDLSVTGY